MQKERKEIKELCGELTDILIDKLLEGKVRNVDIVCALQKDLMERNITGSHKWDEIYSKQPSFKHLEGIEYKDAMREKYITVYKTCLELK